MADIVKQFHCLQTSNKQIAFVLCANLQEATSPENRALRPWIITMGHRPMYCSNSDRDDCTKHESKVC